MLRMVYIINKLEHVYLLTTYKENNNETFFLLIN